MAIETLAYMIVADTSQFTTGVKATGRELRFMKAAMLETATPAEKLQMKLDALGKLHAEGKMQPEAHAKAVLRLKEAFEQTQKSAAGTHAELSGVEQVLKGIIPTFDLVGAGARAFDLLREGIMAVNEQFAELQKTVLEARKMEMDPGNLVAFKEAAEDLGVEEETAIRALKQMQKVIGDAAEGNKTAEDSLRKLGLSARELLELPVEEEFIKIAEAIQHFPTAAERSAHSSDIFAKSSKELGLMLKMTREEFARIIEETKETGQWFSPDQAKQIEESRKAILAAKDAWEGLKTQIALSTVETRTWGAETATILLKQYRSGVAPIAGVIAMPDLFSGPRAMIAEANKVAEEVNQSIADKGIDWRKSLGEVRGAGEEEFGAKMLKDTEDTHKRMLQEEEDFWKEWQAAEEDAIKEWENEWKEWQRFQDDADREQLQKQKRFSDDLSKLLEMTETPLQTFNRELAALGEAPDAIEVGIAKIKYLHAELNRDRTRPVSTTALMGGTAAAFEQIARNEAVSEEAARKARLAEEARAIGLPGGGEAVGILQAIERNTRRTIEVNEVDSLEPAIN